MCPYGRPRICIEDIQMDLRETGYENGRWIMVNLPTAVLYNEFHNICYFLKKKMLLFLCHWYTAQWISVGCNDEMIIKCHFLFVGSCGTGKIWEKFGIEWQKTVTDYTEYWWSASESWITEGHRTTWLSVQDSLYKLWRGGREQKQSNMPCTGRERVWALALWRLTAFSKWSLLC